VKALLSAYDPDVVEPLSLAQVDELRRQAACVFTGEVNAYLDQVRRVHEQKIDLLNPDEVVHVGWSLDQAEAAKSTVEAFRAWVEGHRDDMVALSLFYAQPYRRRELTFAVVKSLVETLLADRPTLAPLTVWRAWEHLEAVAGRPLNEWAALVALVRRVAGLDTVLTAYDRTVDKNFQTWVMRKQAGPLKFTRDQMEWLTLLKQQIATSVHVALDDLDYTPFDARGGRGKMYQLFGAEMEAILQELNEALGA
jgi:type I restriction enzyme R subunit